MRWRKLGQLYNPIALHPKLASHAANPLPVLLEGDVYRVFFSGRDTFNRSSVGYVDVDIERRTVIYAHDKPVFEFGPSGSFYSHGVSVGCCYSTFGERYILFMGWQVPEAGHWRGEIGRLRLGKDYSLTLDGESPFMGVDATDPLSLSYPWVTAEGKWFRMWYGSTVAWDAGNCEMLHVINCATSDDGHRWARNGLALPYEQGVAQAFSRPTVLANIDGYYMWFSYRSGRLGETYRIGYAYSATGDAWELRLGEVGIDVSASGWDSEMIEYPCVFEHEGESYMLYNGNGYGRTGFGLAVLER